ncbi:TetR/AcrR family transcriptional regulator [Bacillus coreaensis]
MNGFERRRLQKMEQIRQAAFSLFTKYGIQKVKIHEIAKKANVSQVTIYNYFGSKDELVYDVLKDYLEGQIDSFQQLIYSELPFQEKLIKLIELKLSSTNDLSTEFIEAIVSENSVIANLFQEFANEKSMLLIVTFIEEGRKSGDISSSLSMNTILFILQAMTDAIQKHSEIFQSRSNKDQFINEFIHFFFYGIVGKKEDL